MHSHSTVVRQMYFFFRTRLKDGVHDCPIFQSLLTAGNKCHVLARAHHSVVGNVHPGVPLKTSLESPNLP